MESWFEKERVKQIEKAVERLLPGYEVLVVAVRAVDDVRTGLVVCTNMSDDLCAVVLDEVKHNMETLT